MLIYIHPSTVEEGGRVKIIDRFSNMLKTNIYYLFKDLRIGLVYFNKQDIIELAKHYNTDTEITHHLKYFTETYSFSGYLRFAF